ncbi:hypothetical protein L227DRAFT_178050 [Lentinus tigrinus ALCF2SS1-6]|uniref:Uncharacterized protein n=1 Tax=Lentinus tigrinus ALCF2SS1-6 TaxID=1328759 RepID=A0A5C2S525_9APHY|nr:hypothetical protein L227DRAFT_178050 [Lentinus tigrinus ALCF2SS1-6]
MALCPMITERSSTARAWTLDSWCSPASSGRRAVPGTGIRLQAVGYRLMKMMTTRRHLTQGRRDNHDQGTACCLPVCTVHRLHIRLFLIISISVSVIIITTLSLFNMRLWPSYLHTTSASASAGAGGINPGRFALGTARAQGAAQFASQQCMVCRRSTFDT